MKKAMSLVLCVVMLVTMVACGNQKGEGKASLEETKITDITKQTETGTQILETASEEKKTEGINFNEEPYTLNICYAVGGEAQPDLALIQEKLNEITLKEMNAQVKLEAVSLFSMANVYALKASGQEKMDLMLLFPGYSYLTAFANSNLIMPIEEYVDTWGGNLTKSLGEMMEAGRYKGHLYAIPQKNVIRKGANGFLLSRALCEKYKIEPDSIKTIQDLEAAFEIIKENEPGIIVLMPEAAGSSIAGSIGGYFDTCGTGGGIAQMQDDGKLKIVNQTEDENFINACRIAYEWYQKGYISKDILTMQEDAGSAIRAGKCFALAANSINANMGNAYAQAVLIDDVPPMLTTTDDQLIIWAVASSCERPDKAVQFLNMCIASEEITNLMMYGIEGTHYKVLEDGTIDISDNVNWQNPWPMFGDGSLLKVRADEMASMPGVTTTEEYQKKLASWNLELSPAYGFNFDPEKVKTQIAACDAISDEFRLVISNGTVDPSTQMDKWTNKLYDAGLQDIMDEKQKQLGEWLASK